MGFQRDVQRSSGGASDEEIVTVALEAAEVGPGLTWLDIGCGTGDVLRPLAQSRPAGLCGIDIIDRLDAELRPSVTMLVGPAESCLAEAAPADRVLIVETMEHLEAPWTVLRGAAKKVATGGIIVVTTPNITNLRSRAELLLRGTLTSFRHETEAHLGPILPHVTARILREQGLVVQHLRYAGRDVMPKTGGRRVPRWLWRVRPSLFSSSTIVTAQRPS